MRTWLPAATLLIVMSYGLSAVADLATGLSAFEDKRFTVAHRELLKAAQQESMEAKYYLGLIYDRGLGRKEDPQAALAWFMKAAQDGHAESQRVVGIYYQEGKAVCLLYTSDAADE